MTNDLRRAMVLHRRAKTKTFDIPELSAELTLAIDAAATLADAYLAEHDETKLDHEWLVKVLGEPDDPDPTIVSVWKPTIHWDAMIVEDGPPGCVLGYFGQDDKLNDFVDLTTRADAIAYFRLVKWPVDPKKILEAAK